MEQHDNGAGGTRGSQDFHALIEAMAACADDATGAQLRDWVQRHGANSDVLVVGADGAVDNRGSPLLIACECDLPEACAKLIRLGADVNYRHPASHGNTPALRCAEMGFCACLNELLAEPELRITELVTNEYKLVLGQNLPQYEAGGRSALLLAVEACRLESVEALLRHPQGCELLKMRDSFGRTPLEAAFEALATKTESCSCARMDTICRALCQADSLDYAQARGALLLSAEAAVERERERARQLRSRYLVQSNRQRTEELSRGLAAVKAGYEPGRLHPQVFRTIFEPECLLLPSTTCRAEDSSEHALVEEPVPGVFAFPFLTKAHCAKIHEEILHYEEVARTSPELCLPLYQRHDGNLGQLEACGFEPLLRAIEAAWRPLVARFLPEKGDCQVYHAFLTRNHVEREENATFKIHCDKSDLTFNLCLQASDDCEGSTVGFYADVSGEGSAGVAPTEEERVYTHTHRVGYALMHDGEQFHKTDAITCGTRCSLIVWARLVGSPCAACGASMGASWLFCKACGKEIAGR